MKGIEKAIKERDFDSFASITMADSNQFHAVCLDTAPPIFYLNDVSRSLIALVEELNRASVEQGNGLVAAYTFDAGPNCVIYALEQNVETVIQAVQAFFPQQETFKDPFGLFGGKEVEGKVPQGFEQGVIKGAWEKGAVKSLIHTKVGDGPRRLSEEESLLAESGLPKTLV
jgi:diphosphomevalonate decarboxylase